MTERAESLESTNRIAKPGLANQNKEFKRNPMDVKSETDPPSEISLVETDTVLSSGSRNVRDIQPVSDASIASVNELPHHNKSLGDIFEEELDGDENSDSGSLIEDNFNQNKQNFLEGINLTNPTKLASRLVSREERLRKRTVPQHFMDEPHGYTDFKVKTETSQSKPVKIEIGQILPEEKDNIEAVTEIKANRKPIRARQVPAREKEKMFEIYMSGQRMFHSVQELKEHELQTVVNTELNERNKVENTYGIKSVPSPNTRNSKLKPLQGIDSNWTEQMGLVALESRETGLYVNFENIQETEIKSIESEETVESEVKSKSDSVDIKKRDDGRFVCPECGQAFLRRVDVWWHVQIVHLGQSPFKCDVCGKLFPNSSRLRRHTIFHIRKKHIGDTPFICDICLETFPSKQCLKDHITTHTEKMHKFVCEHCGKTFSHKSNYHSHRRVHDLKDVAPSFKCPDLGCGLLFKTQERLDKHLAHKRAEQKFICDVCGYKSKRKQDLEHHIEINHTENRKPKYFCEQCNKYFYHKQNYTIHVENHRGMARYVCECCNIAFAGSNTLKRHYLRKAGLYVRPKSKNKKS